MYTRIRRLLWKVSLLTAIVSLLAVTVALAAPGDLDLTFDGDGMTNTNFGDDLMEAIALQSDGKIVAAGYTSIPAGASEDFAVARYTTSGLPDTTFSGDGKLTTNFGAIEEAKDVAVQPNGKIVVAGIKCIGNNCDVAMARYNANGTPDTTFSGDGKHVTDFRNLRRNNRASALALQADGKILVAGYLWNGTTYDFAVYRFNTNGGLDLSFSGDGVSVGFFAAGNPANDYANDLVIQSNGKIVVVGTTGTEPNRNFALARLNANGSLDTTFGNAGITVTGFGGDDDANAVALQSNGKIVVVGEKYDPVTDLAYMAVARYNLNGTPDTTFNTVGRRVYSIIGGGDSWAEDVVVQADNKIVVLGNVVFGNPNYAVLRLNGNGAPDTTFSGDGRLQIEFGPGGDLGRAIALQPADGKYVLGGASWVDADLDFALLRVLP